MSPSDHPMGFCLPRDSNWYITIGAISHLKHMRTAGLFLMVAAFTVTSAAQAVKYNYEYKCPETVIVRYCRNDSGQKVHELDNYCHVEYPDRPRRMSEIAVFRSVVKGDLAVELKNCKGPVPSDPAIAKAAAAKVDTEVFGIQLGDPFSVPACPMFGPAGLQTCYSALDEQLGGLARGPNEPAPNFRTVRLATDKCPSWVSQCMLVVELFEGKVGYVGVFTKGPSVDKIVQDVLAEKYGKWSLSRGATINPGSTEKPSFRVTEYWWNLPGLYIHYEPVRAGPEGVTADIRSGLIRIETETGRKARADEAAKRLKPKM